MHSINCMYSSMFDRWLVSCAITLVCYCVLLHLHTLTFNDDVFGRPLLVEGGEPAVLTDTDDMLSEVKVLCVKAEQAEPQVSHRLCVPPVLGPATGLQVTGYKDKVLKTISIQWLYRHNTVDLLKYKTLTNVFKSSKKYTFQPSTIDSGFFFPS